MLQAKPEMWVEEKRILEAANIVTGAVDAGVAYDAAELRRLRATYEKQPAEWFARQDRVAEYAADLAAPFPAAPTLNDAAVIAKTLK